MKALHESFMAEINEIRYMFPNVPNSANFVQQPAFEYDIAANTLFVFKEYKNREVLIRMNYIPAAKLFAVDITEFPKDTNKSMTVQSGYFNLDAVQLEHKFKQLNRLFYLVEIVNGQEPNVRSTYYALIKSIIIFYKKVFPQWN